ncbi:MAG: adenosylmethionine--8-amino-7-oxononanoate transaminase [Desulfovibrionaceae bacterium]|nr:adenosylmethionine--8-amino-7-oxononanoate transaminase [Desulfovibrionaceae bacterium]MBF0515444.1 adenosylmethionine--8-amino-7-oxononanoate transaminase [Desulfovibrionaceae bacterium]
MTEKIWHPCMQMHDTRQHPIITIDRGQGIYLYDVQGNSYIDAISSWWVNLFGHANPRIVRALTRQAQKLEQVIFSGFSHEPAERLSERLLALLPDALTKIFFADNGSCAVEAALKMCRGYFRNAGHPEKTKFAFLTHGYHGETLGALSVCGEALYRDAFAPLIVPQIEVVGPDCFRCPFGETRQACDAPCFAAMERAVAGNARELAAVIVEPLVQCAGNFRIYPPVYLRKLRELTREAGVLLIFDEIAVGFGRTGTMFALEQAGVRPDLLCLSKGITSGTLPLSLVAVTEEIYQAFYGEYAKQKAFLHSHSYTGNALACAVAVETLNIFRDEDALAANRPKHARLRRAVEERFGDFKHTGEVRSLGFICAVELVADRETKEPFDWKRRLGYQIYRKALTRGALLRNLGEIIYFMPPYVITEDEIETLADIAWAATRDALG